MMTEREENASEASTDLLPQEFEAPHRSLSSMHVGWEGLVSYGFHEPKGMEGWMVSPRGDIMLMVYAGGAIHVERRLAHGPWKGEDIYPGDLVWHWGSGPCYETRWWSLSAAPTRAMDVHLSRQSVNHIAEELIGKDLASLALEQHTVIRDPLLTQIALTLWQELKPPAPAGRLYAQTAAQLLAVHLVRQYAANRGKMKGTPLAPGELTTRQVKQVREFIQQHLSEDLSLEAVAQEISFSPYHFARLFRRTMGVTLHQFVLRQRIEHAQWLLRETELPLFQVAFACGFSDQSHLNQVFKQHLGSTPRAYRQENSCSGSFGRWTTQ